MRIEKPTEVYFFGTCLIDLIYPRAGLSAVQLIQREGVRVIYPQQQTCCGQPAWNSGYRDEARAVARQQIGLFSKPIPIVIPSGSCAGMMKIHYPELFSDQADEGLAVDIAGRVFELTEFLTDILDIVLDDLGDPIQVAVHTSCSARREMGVAENIEKLLGQLDRVEVLEQENKAECCGFGGSFAIKQPEISAAMVADKTEALRNTKADAVVSQDCGCLMNIEGAMEFEHKQDGLKAMAVRHIAEFLWQRTAGEES